jgi:hypothetical protein
MQIASVLLSIILPICLYNILTLYLINGTIWGKNSWTVKYYLIFSTTCVCNTCNSKKNSATYDGVSKIFRTDALKFINLTTKRLWKLPTSTQLHTTWHTDSLDMVVLPSTGASR